MILSIVNSPGKWMNKVCSLDFLNDECFKTDIKTSNGVVLFHAGDKITPEIILKLYFKEIYTGEASTSQEIVSSLTEIHEETEITEIETSEQIETVEEAEVETEKVVEVETEEELPEEEELTEVETSEEIETIEEVEVKTEEETIETEKELVEAEETSKTEVTTEAGVGGKTKKSKGPKLAAEGSTEEVTEEEDETSTKGPKLAESRFDKEEEKEEEELEEENLKGPRAASTKNGKDEKTKGPRQVDTTLEAKTDEKEAKKGPKLAQDNLISEDKEKKGPKSSGKSKFEEEEKEEKAPVEENPEEKQLEFDESMAKRIVKSSLDVGKMLELSAEELKELEQVAYYCNIGITNFKKADSRKRGFSKMKFHASYQKLLEEGTIPAEIAEKVKLCANNYESENFPLESKIPSYHIVAMISYYEDLLAKNNSKEETLLKMLQMGGNRFNIFILHKFIRMMRELNG